VSVKAWIKNLRSTDWEGANNPTYAIESLINIVEGLEEGLNTDASQAIEAMSVLLEELTKQVVELTSSKVSADLDLGDEYRTFALKLTKGHQTSLSLFRERCRPIADARMFGHERWETVAVAALEGMAEGMPFVQAVRAYSLGSLTEVPTQTAVLRRLDKSEDDLEHDLAQHIHAGEDAGGYTLRHYATSYDRSRCMVERKISGQKTGEIVWTSSARRVSFDAHWEASLALLADNEARAKASAEAAEVRRLEREAQEANQEEE
jgi:hypothetical protein